MTAAWPDRGQARARVRLRPHRRGALGGGQKNYIGLLIDHKQPECAETFSTRCRARFCTGPTSTIDACSSARGVDRAHRRRSAFVPLVLSAAERPAARTDRRRPRLPARLPVRRFPPRPAQPPRRVPGAVPAPVRARGEPPAPGALLAVLPQPHGLHRRPRHQRVSRVPVRGSDQARRRWQALRGRPADGTGAHRTAVLGQPRVLPGGHGGAVGVRRLPAGDGAGAHRGGALHDGRSAEAGENAVLPRLSPPSQALDRFVHRRSRHQGAGNDGVHAAIVPVRVQGHPRRDRALEGHDPGQGEGEVRAGEAPRPRRAHGGHARVLRRRVPARASRRSWSRNCRGWRPPPSRRTAR